MRLGREFFLRDALEVAPELVGKTLVSSLPGAQERRLVITETEVYRGVEDSACHAHRGRTKRTEMLYRPGGAVYVYLCYGIHWLLNVITGPEDFPQGVLIRACEGFEGPGKLTKYLGITGAQNGIDICSSPLLRIEDEGRMVNITTDKRVGIAYAEEADRERLWRFKRG
ncbi:MAG: DNA-3-methyladenine glycosylase [Oscillospiraceae bacterium]|jgi:DNA-3-methyladenine glycosylase|nr:DNA-3-methyladenine glycosylase [Oscillospiraceae bacterium]